MIVGVGVQCRWQNGECRFGDRCNFAHGDDELRNLPPRQDAGPGGRGRGRGRGGGYGEYRDDGYGRGHQGGRGHYGGAPGSAPGGEHDPEWVASGCPVAGPNGWTQYTDKGSGDKYYHNKHSNQTQWEKPAEWQDAP